MLKGKTVVLGVTGSIAAYKIADLASKSSKLHCACACDYDKECHEFYSSDYI